MTYANKRTVISMDVFTIDIDIACMAIMQTLKLAFYTLETMSDERQ